MQGEHGVAAELNGNLEKSTYKGTSPWKETHHDVSPELPGGIGGDLDPPDGIPMFPECSMLSLYVYSQEMVTEVYV